MGRVKGSRALWTAMWMAIFLALSAWTPIQSCGSVGYIYRQVVNTQQIGSDFIATQGGPAVTGDNPILVVYRIDDMWNRTGSDFAVEDKNFRSCTNKDGDTVLLPIPGAEDPKGKITLKDGEGISPHVALVFFCTLKPGEKNTQQFDLTYTDPKLKTLHGGLVPFKPSITSLPD
jgi:hypothetical protein